MLAIITAFTPMPPVPKTTTLSPGWVRSTFTTLPMPVGAAQPSSTPSSMGRPGGSSVRRFSLTSAWRWKVVTPPAFTRRPPQS